MTMCFFMRLWTCVVCCVVISRTRTVIGSDSGSISSGSSSSSSRGRSTAKCPSDVREATRQCLQGYTDQLDALHQSDNRFFPGLDVEVIRSLCSVLDDSMRCVQTLVEACPRGEQHAIEEELSPHLGVRQLCMHPNIYEEYAMNQNCFVRVRSGSETCFRDFQVSVQEDEHIEHQSSSSASSQRHQTSQQRQYCSHVKRLMSCVKNHVRSAHSSCQKMALKLVEVLVRASLPTAIVCRDDSTATPPPPTGRHPMESSFDSKSSGSCLRGSLSFWCLLFATFVCAHARSFSLNSFTTAETRPANRLLLSVDPSLRRRHHHHHHRRRQVLEGLPTLAC